MRVSPGDWCYSLDHDEPGRVIAVEAVWGEEIAQVWLARRDAVVRLHRSRLQPLAGAVAPSLDQLCYVASAARILDAMERDALIAPLEGSVIPLPHQLYALQRAMSADRVRWEHIQRVYEQCDRNVSETARRLSMHRRTLQRILAKRSPR